MILEIKYLPYKSELQYRRKPAKWLTAMCVGKWGTFWESPTKPTARQLRKLRKHLQSGPEEMICRSLKK